jgi:2-C-methyl-D-erythritol 2,4-cyclodiphosphate synthase
MIKIRSGIGYDIHRLVPGDGLILGGVKIAADLKAEAHSDGDVLMHSLIDALLGAIGQPDIGELFPDSDPAYKGAASSILLEKAKALLDTQDFEIINLDSVVIIEAPKITPFKNEIKKNISRILGISESDFNLKAKTKERLDAVGRGVALECFSIAMVRSKK